MPGWPASGSGRDHTGVPRRLLEHCALLRQEPGHRLSDLIKNVCHLQLVPVSYRYIQPTP